MGCGEVVIFLNLLPVSVAKFLEVMYLTGAHGA